MLPRVSHQPVSILAFIVIFAAIIGLACAVPYSDNTVPLDSTIVEGSSLASPQRTQPSITSFAQPSSQIPGPFCPLLPPPQITNLNVYQTPLLDEPAPRMSYHDPVFGTCIARVTDRLVDLLSGDRSIGIRNEAAHIQSFNADSSLILTLSTNSYWYIYSADTLELTGVLPFAEKMEVRWDPIQPKRLYILRGTSFLQYDLDTEVVEQIHDFQMDIPNKIISEVSSGNFGNPTIDGRYWGLYGKSSNGQVVTLLVYDLMDNVVISRLDLPEHTRLQGVTISPLGNYFLAWHDGDCEVQTSSAANPTLSCGLMIYDRSLENGRRVSLVSGEADTALDANGNEVFIYHDLALNSISLLNLSTGEEVALWLIDSTHSTVKLHLSGRSVRQPGWALVSSDTGNQDEANTWMDNSIFAIELIPEGRVVRLAHTHLISTQESLDKFHAGPDATSNLNFTRIVFTSNWGRQNEDEVDLYMLGLPSDWMEQLP